MKGKYKKKKNIYVYSVFHLIWIKKIPNCELLEILPNKYKNRSTLVQIGHIFLYFPPPYLVWIKLENKYTFVLTLRALTLTFESLHSEGLASWNLDSESLDSESLVFEDLDSESFDSSR